MECDIFPPPYGFTYLKGTFCYKGTDFKSVNLNNKKK